MTSLAVCLKWVPTRIEVDPITGAAQADARFSGTSAADQSALEWALRLAEGSDDEVVVVTAGPAGADQVLRDAVAAGAGRAVRVDVALDAPSSQVARALASALRGVDLTCCGDYSLDRGTGSVPAFLAGELSAAQALGLVDAEAAGPGDPARSLRVTRRLDQGRREILTVTAPAVLSFEGRLELRRAPLRRLLEAAHVAIEVVPGPVVLSGPAVVTEVRRGPYRPRARALPPPAGDTRQRILSLTGALTQQTPPQLLELEPAEAAARILEQLRTWGHLPHRASDPTTAAS